MKDHERNSFSSSLGFVLAAAGSAVGLGNIWRFPYLAARDGGGLFLLIYLILALTFGFTLLTTEIAIGRKTRQGPLTAYGVLNKKWKPLGFISCIVPIIIMPYYCAIGGWVLKYLTVYLTGQGSSASSDGYFGGFISGHAAPIIFMIIFLLISAVIVIAGVDKGIEKFSKIVMPILIGLIIFIAIYSVTLSNTDAYGVTRTGLQGLKILFVPDFTGLTPAKFLTVVMDAMGQLFYSLSVAMGIMIAYGSYMKDDVNLGKSVTQIEFFDTGIAFLAGIMIVPAVFVFMGHEGIEASGPGLMFITIPKVFEMMGGFGVVLGILFFAMVLFAAITSAVSIMEAVVSSFMDAFGWSRIKAVIIETIIALGLGTLVCLGYNALYFEVTLPNGATAQILDIMDYISNNILMPAGAIGTCILIGWVLRPKTVIDEVTKNGERFGRRRLFIVMVRFVAPIILLALLLKAFGVM